MKGLSSESSIFYGKKVMAKVKVFVHASNADADAYTRAMTLAPGHSSLLAKMNVIYMYNFSAQYVKAYMNCISSIFSSERGVIPTNMTKIDDTRL